MNKNYYLDGWFERCGTFLSDLLIARCIAWSQNLWTSDVLHSVTFLTLRICCIFGDMLLLFFSTHVTWYPVIPYTVQCVYVCVYTQKCSWMWNFGAYRYSILGCDIISLSFISLLTLYFHIFSNNTRQLYAHNKNPIWEVCLRVTA